MSVPAPIPRLGGALAVLVVAALVVAGCGRGPDFPDKTAVVTIDGHATTYALDSCGRDGQTLFLVGRAPDGAIVQGVVGLKKDHRTGVLASTGVSIDLDPSSDDTRLAAFGAEAWDRRGLAGDAPGTITSARLRGSRIQFGGDVVSVDRSDAPVAGSDAVAFSVDARCDEEE